ncbi:amino acid ABC transporter permease [Pseudothermotoga lettingae]|uniref:Polar amino acid ABC transporter, inner membrane subunit n=1 Tax=Pseudothermotoga lettingae (strain ATCC BAA-301 / DSM 14385 / NBRC 107922 / TMO) TaxID=416591 RepID=A8F362_PSELT|nr:amino acid ABC transporter permease [Pseudothermotoga lettingae]ABV32596.1 polar amino acid ABC transporter, inner membrane subunit [Pseudothermotoga lettingae TMO]GLI48417.1 putative glutamine ABC transporter permease protein GlnP [Pseudothermotoga lettingae TMO]
MQSMPFTQQVLRLGNAFLQNLVLLPFVLIMGIFFGFIIALIRYYKIPVLSQFFAFAIEIVRGSPFLLLVYAVYFVLPYFGIELQSFETAVVVLTITSTVYLSEVFRSGLLAIDKGQFEAADALGMSFANKLFLIILPQVLQITLPSIVGQIVLTIKDTSIVSLIGMAEIVRTSRQVMQITLDPFTAFLIVAGYFAAVCYPLILVSRKLEQRILKGGKKNEATVR